jgi:hypothetical protein
MDEYFPGMEKKYGQDVTGDMEIKLLSAGDFSVKAGNSTMLFETDLAVKLWINSNDSSANETLALNLVL